MLVFEERGKPEYLEKNLLEQGENQQQTQPTYDAGSENRTQATLVGGSHHCATFAPHDIDCNKSYRGVIFCDTVCLYFVNFPQV